MKPFLFTIFVLFSSCATIVSKSTYKVNINSEPSGANFEVHSSAGGVLAQGITPAVVSLRAQKAILKSASYTVKFQKDGYSPKTAALGASVDMWILGNLFLGAIPLGIDIATGAMYKLPTNVIATMEPGGSVTTETPVAKTPESEMDKKAPQVEEVETPTNDVPTYEPKKP